MDFLGIPGISGETVFGIDFLHVNHKLGCSNHLVLDDEIGVGNVTLAGMLGGIR